MGQGYVSVLWITPVLAYFYILCYIKSNGLCVEIPRRADDPKGGFAMITKNDECTVAIAADNSMLVIDLGNLPYRKVTKLQKELPLDNLPKRPYVLGPTDWLEALALHLFVHIGKRNVLAPDVDDTKGTISFIPSGSMEALEIQLYIREFLSLARFGPIDVS